MLSASPLEVRTSAIFRKGDEPDAFAFCQKFAKMCHFDEICAATNRARIHGELRQKSIRCGADTSKQSVHSGFLAYVFMMP